MKRRALSILLLALALLCARVAWADPCQDKGVVKQWASIIISVAGTTDVVAAVTAQSIYVCSLSLSATGTAPSLQIEYGTGTNCATGPVAMTGTMLLGGTALEVLAWGGSVLQTPPSQELCFFAGGTSPSIMGVLTYVQQ